MITLRPYQERAVAATRASIMSGKRSPLLVAPTGAGKTTIASAIVQGRVARGGKVAWLAHRHELIKQAAATLESFGVHCGYLGAEPSAPVQVVSTQTVLARGTTPDADLIIVDEAHHYAAEQWAAVPAIYKNAGAIVIGLTATPERGDGVGLHGTFDDMIVAAQIGELVQLGHLLPSEVVRPSPDLTMEGNVLAQWPVDAWVKHGEDRSAVVFAPNVKSAEVFREGFQKQGIRAEVVHGKLKLEDRDRHLAGFDAGEYPVIINVGILTEGWDCPRASCCIFARKVGNTSLYLQMVGRVLRPHEGQSYAKVIDLAGVVEKHGPPEEEREYFLEGMAVRRKGETVTDRFCRVCKAIMTEDGPCSECGSSLGGTSVPRVIGVELERYAWAQKLSSDKRVNMLARWYKEAEAKGHKATSVHYKYKAIFKHWPGKGVISQANDQNGRTRENGSSEMESEGVHVGDGDPDAIGPLFG